MPGKNLIHSSKITYILFTVISMFIGVMVFAHEDEHGKDVNNETELMQTDTVNANESMLDSAYSLIRENYFAVEPIFKRSCYDCHSDQGRLPWYSNLPLVKRIIESDIKNARKHLDMTNGFPFGGHGLPADDLAEIREVVEDGEMPLFTYLILHWNARLSDSAKDSIYTWVDTSLKLLAAHGQHPSENDEPDGDD